MSSIAVEEWILVCGELPVCSICEYIIRLDIADACYIRIDVPLHYEVTCIYLKSNKIIQL